MPRTGFEEMVKLMVDSDLELLASGRAPEASGLRCAAPEECDLAVVGGGILGLAVARELTRAARGCRRVVLEAGPAVAGGQTGANSGVIHAGIYYLPGSLKARLCVEGAREMYEFCEREGIHHERCGKVIVARDDSELGRLDELERRGRENQVPGLRRLSAGELAEVEPHCRGVAALHSPGHRRSSTSPPWPARWRASSTPRACRSSSSCGVEAVAVAAGRIGLRHARRRDARALCRVLRGRRARTGSPWPRARRADPRIVAVPRRLPATCAPERRRSCAR